MDYKSIDLHVYQNPAEDDKLLHGDQSNGNSVKYTENKANLSEEVDLDSVESMQRIGSVIYSQ